MVCKIYAFLVGIDAYPQPLPPLRGCVNDIDAFEQYLYHHVQGNPDCVLQPPYRLTNDQATRKAIIEGFRNYLTQAQSGDVALFYYSGHGSQAPSPPEFWTIEPDRFNETLVCWDSRLEGQWDLADKELASLIAEVDRTQPHIVIILDCCHSGAGTRQFSEHTATRQVPADLRQRPFDTFLLPFEGWPAVDLARGNEALTSRSSLPKGRHILLAACRENEEAREFLGGDQHRGAFSYFLLETLAQTKGSLSYRDVFRRANARVRTLFIAQSPQLEATCSVDLDRPFLGTSPGRLRSYYTVSHSTTHGWIIDGGAVHGIPMSTSNDTPEVAIIPFDADSKSLQIGKNIIARANIIEVLPHLSLLRIFEGESSLADTQGVFKAVVTTVPLPAITVSLVGEETGVSYVREALRSASPEGQPSSYIREVPESAPAQLQVFADENAYWIRRSTDLTLLVNPIQGFSESQGTLAIRQLEHIARWMTVADLSNPSASKIPTDALHIEIYCGNQTEPLTQPQIYLTYEWDGRHQRWQQPTFRIKLVNNSNLNLFCALYDLQEDFQIKSLLEGGTVRLAPQEEVWVAQGQSIYGSVPKVLWQEGITEVHDILKIIACTADFDALLLEQRELGYPTTRTLEYRPSRCSTLNHLMQRAIVRSLDFTPEDETFYDDWVTSQVTFTVMRPQEAQSVSPNRLTDLGHGITLSPHPSLQATARLTTLSQMSRSLSYLPLPPLLQADPHIAQPFQLVPTRNLDLSLNILELGDVTQSTAVTPEHPLILHVPLTLKSNEYVLPLAFDGEFFIPLGRGHGIKQDKGATTEILLERLPNPNGEGVRKLGGSIRILFQKIAAQQLGLEFPYPVLATVDFLSDDTLRYEANRTVVAQRVKEATRILLLIHGFLGDTQSMVLSLQHAQVEVDGQPCSILDFYDLVLTFDYENINTPLGDIAKQLGEHLASVGLDPNHGNTLHLITHSIGGLVARCFIEQQNGHQVVQHLVMLGTPNAGTPWPTVQDWATAALTIGLNSLSAVAFPVKALGSLMAAIEMVDITLDQIKPGSDFLRSLLVSADSSVPYTVLVGNASLIPLSDANTRNQIIRLLDRVGRAAVEFPFLSQPNDLVSTVYSMKALPPERSSPTVSVELACHHFNYLTNTDALQALGEILVELDQIDYPSIKNRSSKAIPVSLKPMSYYPVHFWLVGLGVVLSLAVVVGIWLIQQRSDDSNSHLPVIPILSV